MTIDKLRPYAKFVVAVAGGVAYVASAILLDGATVSSIVIAVLTAAGVYRVPNQA